MKKIERYAVGGHVYQVEPMQPCGPCGHGACRDVATWGVCRIDADGHTVDRFYRCEEHKNDLVQAWTERKPSGADPRLNRTVETGASALGIGIHGYLSRRGALRLSDDALARLDELAAIHPLLGAVATGFKHAELGRRVAEWGEAFASPAACKAAAAQTRRAAMEKKRRKTMRRFKNKARVRR
jgi:hypothetical protein